MTVYRSSNSRLKDQTTGSDVGMTFAHHELHEGNAFAVDDTQNVNTTTLKWLITTPNTTSWSHMLFDISCTGELYVVITEGADRTGTTLLTNINRNRNSSETSALTVHRAFSGGSTDGATIIFQRRDGNTGIGGKTVSSGGLRGVNEFILKQNTKYVVSATTYADEYVSFSLDWYKHTNL